MEVTLEKICGKPSDFKLCTDCKAYVFYDYHECPNCGLSHSFIENNPQAVIEQLEEEYRFYKEDGYDETFIDNIEVCVGY